MENERTLRNIIENEKHLKKTMEIKDYERQLRTIQTNY